MSGKENEAGMAKQIRGSLLLMLAAFIWGVAFVAQSVGMEYVGPFTFISVRFLLGSAVLLPVIAAGWKRASKRAENKEQTNGKELILGGLCCGTALFVASSLQQIGISHTTVGKAGFITALYIIFVPLFGIFFRRIPGIRVWIAVMMSALGLYLLCMKGSFQLSLGDTYVFCCAVAFSIHILLVDYFSGRVDPIWLSCLQFFVCGIAAAVPMLLLEAPRLSALWEAAVPILYAGILSSGVAFTLQVVAQKDTNPTAASLIMSLESVFSVLAGWVLLGQKLSWREGLGCILMFSAMILAQLPGGKKVRDSQ